MIENERIHLIIRQEITKILGFLFSFFFEKLNNNVSRRET